MVKDDDQRREREQKEDILLLSTRGTWNFFCSRKDCFIFFPIKNILRPRRLTVIFETSIAMKRFAF